ncbi:hypothetical protein [Pedobacter sp.]|uniref:hypothetical protein n=1 Tax=Pedobacter sp. TaxID=1411316 RepID=UPI003C384568
MKFLAFITVAGMLQSCNYELDNLELQENYFGEPGKMSIQGYVLSDTDSVRVSANDKDIEVNKKTIFTKKLETSYQFVSYFNNPTQKSFKVINNRTQEVMITEDLDFSDPTAQLQDTISFFYKSPSILIKDVYKDKPGKLTSNNHTGFRFMFPNMNYYSKSDYTGTVDAILTKFPSGELIARVENIGKERFSEYIEFLYYSPPIMRLQLVKHGTTESYLNSGVAVTVDISLQTGKSKLIIIEEKTDANGIFNGINASLDLRTYFTIN